MARPKNRRSWESEEQRARREHAVRLVRRGARREVVAAEFGISPSLLGKWVRGRSHGAA